MKLPNARSLIIPEEKVRAYLLNPAHPAGGGKAKFFIGFGFKADEWQRLAEALRRHAVEHEVAGVEQTDYGTRYIVDGLLTAPDGTSLNIRSAWFIDNKGAGAPRLVTRILCRNHELD